MADNHVDYLESLFKGVDILIEKRLDDIAFDTTIICTVTDASKSKNGEYRVTDGSVTYKVYSDLDSYAAGDQVRVSVPMGDFSQKKFIVGKYVIDNNLNPITYTSPLDNIVDISGNLVPIGRTGSITANGPETRYIIWNQRMDNSDYADLQANGIYNTIILQADFKTLLSNYDLIAGTYGLRLDLLVRPSVNSTGRVRRYVELNSKEMFGNPYAFSIFSQQAKTFSIATIGIIEGVELSLFQNGDFIDRTIGPIPPNQITDDIIVNNIKLGFGSDIVNVDDNIVKIYSKNDTLYKYHNHTEDTNLKTLGLLWYNKDEHNQYVGFSDGIYAPQYDELEYLALARMDTRLLAQKGRDGIPTDKESLNLAANIEEAVPLIQKACDVANQDLFRVLTSFRQQVNKITNLRDPLDKLLLSSAGDTYIGKCTDNISKALSDSDRNKCGLIQQYSNILRYAWNIQTNVPEDRRSQWSDLWNIQYYNIINENFIAIRTNVENALKDIQILTEQPGAQFAGYKGIYDVYKVRIMRVLDTIDEYLGIATNEDGSLSVYNKNFPRDVLNGTDYTLLQSYLTKTEFKTYKEQDLSAYANKYCIYWYRYEKDYISSDIESLMPNGWRRLTPDELKGKYDHAGYNVGLAGEDIENVVDGKTHHAKTPTVGLGLFDFYMQHDLNTEKFVALVFYNHNMYKSNELVFTNSDVIPDKTTLDKGDILIFEHGECSSDNFSLYSDLGVLMDVSDGHRARRLRCHYDGLLAKDEALVGAGLYWYVPDNGDATMLTYDIQYLKNRGFTTDADLPDEQKPEFSKAGYICFYKQVAAQKMCSGCKHLLSECSCKEKTAEPYWDYTNGTEFDNRDFWYKIKTNYNESATQNSILCEVRFSEDQDTVKGEQLFTFGTSGTNGTKYTLDVIHTSTMIATTETNGVNLDVILKNALGEKVPLYTAATTDIVPPDNDQSGDFVPSPSERDHSGIINFVTGKQPGEAYNCQAHWYFRNGADDGLRLLPIGGEEATGLQVDPGHFGIIEVTADFAMPEGEAAVDENNAPLKTREVRLDCLQAIPWASNYYYISGPTQIIYNSYGTIDNMSMFNKPYRLFWERDQFDATGKLVHQANEQVMNVAWGIKYYTYNSRTDLYEELVDVAIQADSTTKEINKHNSYVLYNKYMPVINDGGGLTPATLYLDNLDCFAVVQAMIDGNIVWEQPIIILQNRYASPMLNSWDGSLTIDEKNGTILSTMVGAGRKTINNTFEGVLMGNIGAGANFNPDNKNGLGIYGFHDGAQSFGFNIDGTAFLGKSGTGRIIFNGNSGTISSASWEQTNISGMKIDLDDGSIDMRGSAEFISEELQISSQKEPTEDGIVECTYLDSENKSVTVFIPQTRIEERNGNYYILPDWTEDLIKQTNCQTYEDYVQRYGRLYKTDSTNASIHIDVKSPYFDIFSSHGKNIIHIANDQYYLQSDNYVPGNYSLQDGIEIDEDGYIYRKELYTLSEDDGSVINVVDNQNNFIYKHIYVNSDGQDLKDSSGNLIYIIPEYIDTDNIQHPQENYGDFTLRVLGQGQGTKLDLKNGAFDAYNLLLTSKNIYMDSRPGADPFFVIRDNDGCNLLYAGQEQGYYLKSHGFSDTDFVGTKIDLLTGAINAYNFSIHGINNNPKNRGSFINLTSDPLLQAHLIEYPEMSDDAHPEYTEDAWVENGCAEIWGYDTYAAYKAERGILYNENITCWALYKQQHPNNYDTYIDYKAQHPNMPVYNIFNGAIKDLDLLLLNSDNFIMHSKNWNDNSLEIVIFEQVWLATLSDVGLNVRIGPSTSYNKTTLRSAVSSSETVQIYGYTVNGGKGEIIELPYHHVSGYIVNCAKTHYLNEQGQRVGEFISNEEAPSGAVKKTKNEFDAHIEVVKNRLKNLGHTPNYWLSLSVTNSIGDSSSSMWSSWDLSNICHWTFSHEYRTEQQLSAKQGMMISLNEGIITMYNGSVGKGDFIIDTTHQTHPFQIGAVVSEAKNLRRFRIGWDGSVTTSGSKGSWSIDANGLVKCKGARMEDLTVERINIKNNLYFYGASDDPAQADVSGDYNPDRITFTSLAFPNSTDLEFKGIIDTIESHKHSGSLYRKDSYALKPYADKYIALYNEDGGLTEPISVYSFMHQVALALGVTIDSTDLKVRRITPGTVKLEGRVLGKDIKITTTNAATKTTNETGSGTTSSSAPSVGGGSSSKFSYVTML